jgi:hypothetical protein
MKNLLKRKRKLSKKRNWRPSISSRKNKRSSSRNKKTMRRWPRLPKQPLLSNKESPEKRNGKKKQSKQLSKTKKRKRC